MKKRKANSVLVAFVFGFSLLILCAFGVDACYVVLSRNKLQKITEMISLEYAANKARDIENNIEPEEESQKICRKIQEIYQNIYTLPGSGVLAFRIENMEYKADRLKNEAVVKVETSSKVMPVFLKFVGVSQIVIHAKSCAATKKIKIQKRFNESSTSEFGFSDPKLDYVQFSSPFVEDDKSANYITSKNSKAEDFAISFEYDARSDSWGEDEPDMDTKGGFFIFGGYEFEDKNGLKQVKWRDIGDCTLNIEPDFRVCTNGQCFYCINATQKDKITFKLKDDIQRLDRIRIYKAAGTGAKNEDGTYNNPCNPDFVITNEDGEIETPYMKYFSRQATVELTVLNNISLIKTKEYNDFTGQENDADNDTKGACLIERR